MMNNGQKMLLWMVSFYGFDTMKSIVDLSKDESFFKDLVDMLFSFVLQVAKKGWYFLFSN